jgi:ABC-type uncharacterized transport system ATPase subunit
VAQDNVKALKKGQRKVYVLDSPDVKKIKLAYENKVLPSGEMEVSVPYDKTDDFIKQISKFTITNISTREPSLEDIFLAYYAKTEGGAK